MDAKHTPGYGNRGRRAGDGLTTPMLEALELIAYAAEEPWRHAENADGPTYQHMLAALSGIKQAAAEAIAPYQAPRASQTAQ